MTAPVRPSDFVGDLCIALAHRWEPERRFMILTGYFDESGTHGSSPVVVMAGFIGDARQWRKFEKRCARLFKRFRVDIFHTIDIKRSDDDFAGWSVDRKIEFVDEFQHIVNDTLESGFAAILTREDYRYYENLPWPKGTRRDSLYGILFRACVSGAVDGALKIGHAFNGTEPRLNIVLESGHKNAGDTIRIYDFIRGVVGRPSRALNGLTFASKADCLPLAAADLFAYNAWSLEVGSKATWKLTRPPKSDASYRGNAYRIPINRDTLLSLYQQAIDFKAGKNPFAGQPS